MQNPVRWKKERRQQKVDNNPLTQSQAPENPQMQGVPPQGQTQPQFVTPVPQMPKSESGDSKKMIVYLIVGLLVVGSLVFGIYYFISNQQKATDTSQKSAPKQEESVDTLETEIDAVSVDDIDKEFTSVDSDLQNL